MRLILIPFFLLCAAKVYAQPRLLPYHTTFDTEAEKAGWQNVRKGFNHPQTWGISTQNGNTYVYHDYPVEGDTNVVLDWYISPPLKITAGAMLSFSCKVYSITGSATPNDEFSVWIGKGSADPANGTYTKIADMTSAVSSSAMLWHDTLDIPLPFTADTGYIAFKYRATNNWFTVSVDSVLVSRFYAGIKESGNNTIAVFPNPAGSELNITAPEPWQSIAVYSAEGKLIYMSNYASVNCTIDTRDWFSGLYLVRAAGLKGTYSARILKQ